MKILIVEDEWKTLKGLSNLIAELGGEYEIAGQARSGEEGIRMAMELRPDIIITDIELPICDGMELISRLRSIRSPAKIILLTEERGEEYLLKAIKLGVKEYLLKQSNISHIRVAIKRSVIKSSRNKNFQAAFRRIKCSFKSTCMIFRLIL